MWKMTGAHRRHGLIQWILTNGGYTAKDGRTFLQPSIDLRFHNRQTSYDAIVDAGRALGYVLAQESVITFNESDPGTPNDNQGYFVKLTPSRELTKEESDAIFLHFKEAAQGVDGFSRRDGTLVFGNFTFGKVDNQTFYDGIKDAIATAPVNVQINMASKTFRSDYLETEVKPNGDQGQNNAQLDGTFLWWWDGRIDGIKEKTQKRFEKELRGRGAAGVGAG